MTKFEERVLNTKLTKKESAVADFVKKNYDHVWLMKASDVATKLDISASSVIRLANTLAYNGYSDMMDQIRQDYVQKSNVAEKALSPAAKYRDSIIQLSSNDPISTYLNYTAQNTNSIVNYNSKSTLDKAVSLILNSYKKYIIGFHGCRGTADLLFVHLSRIMPDIVSLTHTDSDTISQLLNLSSDDCVILISYPRYADMSIRALSIAKEKGAKIIVITDKISAPVADGADVVLVSDYASGSFFNSSVPQVMLCEVLAMLISLELGSLVDDRLTNLDTYITESGLF